MSDPIHHRRFASGFRACEMGGGSTLTTEDDTEDTAAVTCTSCISELREMGVIPTVRDPIKLSYLVAARAKMTPWLWEYDEPDRTISADSGLDTFEVAEVFPHPIAGRDGDGPGIVATHNAADVLILIAKIAMAYVNDEASRDDLIKALSKVKP